MIEKLHATNLAAMPSLRHGFFTRGGGVSEGVFSSLNCGILTKDDPAKVAQNLALAAGEMGVAADKLLCCKQVHSTVTITVEAPWTSADAPEADAMVTKLRGLALGIMTADCAPVLLADSKAGVIGAAHAGWRGAFDGILESVVAAMEALGATRNNIFAAIGPCIWQDSYEVDPAFMDRFLEQDPQNNRFFFESENPGHFLFELPGYARDKLKKMDLNGIALSPADTCADEARFFSYRRASLKGEADGGRQLSAIALV